MRRIWWRIAWRNLLRNRRRSLITGAALALGFAASVVMEGLSDGIVAEMIENGTGLLSGQVQVHAPDWRPERSLYNTLGGDAGADVESLCTAADTEPGVVATAPRVWGAGLLGTSHASVGAVLLGVDLDRERHVSRLLGSLVKGRLPRAGVRELMVGRSLARKLKVEVGDTLVVVAPAADGSMANDLFRVSGLNASGLSELDAGQAVLPLDVLQRLLVLEPGRVHELAIAIRDPWRADTIAAGVRARLAGTGLPLDAEPWTRFRPELAQYADLASASNGVIVIVVFVMAVFGVANTMLMGTWERRREFAVVRALGTTPWGVGRTVVLEGLLLGVLSLAAGVAITWPVMAWWHRSPPDLSAFYGGFTMAGALVRPTLRVEFSTAAPIESAVALIVTAVVAALYPAWRASRVPPADALAGR